MSERPALRLAVKVALAVGVLLFLYLTVTFIQVWTASRRDQARAVDAIVVLGAAQYDGTPSPVLQARLDHAADLYAQGLAGVIVVTGGKQEGDRTTQAFAGYEYLRRRGVPDSDLLLEVDGTNSWEELAATARILENLDMTSVLLVSDPYHSLRIGAIAGELGLEAWVSPTDLPSSFRSLTRETLAVALGRLIGFRRLSRF